MALTVSDQVEEIIGKAPEWAQGIMTRLREIVLSCGLEEVVKWGAPVYMHHGNVVGMVALKSYVSLWFYEGATLSDPDQILIASSEKTKALRQIRFEKVTDINAGQIKLYVNEAALNMEKGIKTPMPKVKVPEIPDMLKSALKSEPYLKAFFDQLAPSHRREYIEYINEAKREETKLRRLEKSLDLMRQDKGLNAKYKR